MATSPHRMKIECEGFVHHKIAKFRVLLPGGQEQFAINAHHAAAIINDACQSEVRVTDVYNIAYPDRCNKRLLERWPTDVRIEYIRKPEHKMCEK